MTNPFNYNPLVDVLEEIIDFQWLRQNHTVALFVCATNVKTGRIRVFSGKEISVQAVMASACLPFLYKAVEIEGEFFWDGGFMGNPPLYPLIYSNDVEDVLIVEINPIHVDEVPTTAHQILDRMNELSFNSSLMREVRAIHFVQKLLADNRVPHGRYKDVKLHSIEAEREMGPLGYSSKLNADQDFLSWLFRLGREKAGHFLSEHFDAIGHRSSVDIEARFL